jgi:hypothetical protein
MHDRTFPTWKQLGRELKRLWVPALGCSFCAPMVDRAISMPENGSLALALAARSDSCCRRTLHGIHGIVNRMQGPACPFDHFRRDRPLHGATWVHGTADTARNKQPGEETHLIPKSDKTDALKRLFSYL